MITTAIIKMTFQLSEKEIIHHHFQSGVARVLLEQTQEAESHLVSYNGDNLYDTIQNARNCVSRIRSVLRLVKSHIGNDFSAENRRFRELGMELSRLREQHAVVQALEKLKYLSGNINSVLQLENLKERFLTQINKNPEESRRQRKGIGQALNRLRRSQQTFQVIQPQVHDEEVLAEALDHSSQEVMRTYNNALQFGGDDDFYHWRKSVNTLYHQTEMLQNFEFAPAAKKRNFLGRLSAQLDFYNDLTALTFFLDDWKETQLNSDDYNELSTIADNQKRVLAINLLHLGEKFFKMNFSPYKNLDDETFH